jgi:hypothetical protein
MNESKVGQCLPLYLKNRVLLSVLDDENNLSPDLGDDRPLLTQFRERACDQAVQVLEELFLSLFANQVGFVPYRSDRRSQRRTVREYWYVEGRLFRKHEKNARAYWNLYLGSLRDKGPVIAFVLGPQDPNAVEAFDNLATAAAPLLNLDSANPRNGFAHDSGYDAGVIAGFAPLEPGSKFADLVKGLKQQTQLFFNKLQSPFEDALEA